MKIFINFNDYLGGGETLLLRLAQNKSQECIVVTSDNSYIKDQLKKDNEWLGILHTYPYDANFNYMASKDKIHFLNWLNEIIESVKGPIQVVTFCMRDLHLLASLIEERERCDVQLVHLLLHPLDHLYLGQTILDKFFLKFFKINKYNAKENLAINTEIIKRMKDASAIIPMNLNVVKRLKQDTGVDLSLESIVPLPFLNNDPIDNLAVEELNDKQPIKIVWLGRIVDFKLPAILAMIDFIQENEGYLFDIVGYGNEAAIKKYIEGKGIKNRVTIVGKIPHDQLQARLSTYHIGYGMGTSMAELTLCGLPVIVALASPNFIVFNRQVSAGLVYEQKSGNFGDDLYRTEISESDLPLISSSVELINKDRQACFEMSLKHIVNDFSLATNLERYDEILNEAAVVSFKGIKKIKVNFLRKFLLRIFG